jgi:hypothetical protein
MYKLKMSVQNEQALMVIVNGIKPCLLLAGNIAKQLQAQQHPSIGCPGAASFFSLLHDKSPEL